eukprot:gnl/Spiro4/10330_TR5513_c0_g1_i1.p1 gnl/Spiro4/10330_TR5513_c0_g1~~gnl/Spiro4/10330_TR5513_c0_g1_i1.p1  ORF type:complete len:340 (+),score=77.57 gnl/Spiro4/10330_TR5513_c0_g1_i1:61-1020(+)
MMNDDYDDGRDEFGREIVPDVADSAYWSENNLNNYTKYPLKFWTRQARLDPVRPSPYAKNDPERAALPKWPDTVNYRDKLSETKRFYQREWQPRQMEGPDGTLVTVENRGFYEPVGGPKPVSGELAAIIRERLYLARDPRVELDALFEVVRANAASKKHFTQAITKATFLSTLRTMIQYGELAEDVRHGKRYVYLTEVGKKEHVRAHCQETKRAVPRVNPLDDDLRDAPVALVGPVVRAKALAAYTAQQQSKVDAKWVCGCKWGVAAEEAKAERFKSARAEFREARKLDAAAPVSDNDLTQAGYLRCGHKAEAHKFFSA